jgi:minichromosome maintenance protein 10
MLSLLLFESDGFETVPQDEGRPKKVYQGGSRGAFEEMCDLKEGDVVALLNPRILKPFQVRFYFILVNSPYLITALAV